MTASAYMADCNTFYFTDVNGSTLPTRQLHWTSAKNGTFAALNVPAPGLATLTFRLRSFGRRRRRRRLGGFRTSWEELEHRQAVGRIAHACR